MRSEVTRRELLAAAGVAAAGAVTQGVHAQETTAGSWPAYGYDAAKTGYNPDGEGPRSDVGGAWQFDDPTDGITAGVAVADGVVYAASEDGNLYAVEAATGESIDGWPVELGDGSSCPPTVAAGTVYVGDDGGVLFAIDAETGELEWRFGTGGPVSGSPTVVDGTAYVASADGFVYAVETATGEEAVWEFETGADVRGGVAVERGPDGTAETVYAGNGAGGVFALEAGTGELRWDEPFEAQGVIRSAPAVGDGTVYVGTTEGNEGSVYAIDAETGDQQWRFQVGGAVFGSPAVADRVYATSRDGSVYAIDPGSGEESWRFDTGRQLNNAPAVVGETVYAASFDNEVFGLTLDGDERFGVETAGTISASPAVAGGRLYLGSDDGALYALEAGGDLVFETDDDGGAGVEDSPLAEPETEEYAFLILPASVAAIAALFAGGVYALFRSGWTERFAVDEAPIESLYDDESEIPDYEDRSETEAWTLIVGDVIERADERTKTAQENVIVTKYVDDTLESPITAYEIESARERRARVTVTEPLIEGTLDEQPLNEGWRIEDGALVFESTLDPDQRIRTMVGRTDCPGDRFDELLEKPSVTVESLDSSG